MDSKTWETAWREKDAHARATYATCSLLTEFLKLEPANALMNKTIFRLENILTMTYGEFEECIDFSSRLSRFLLSIVKSNGNEKRWD